MEDWTNTPGPNGEEVETVWKETTTPPAGSPRYIVKFTNNTYGVADDSRSWLNKHYATGQKIFDKDEMIALGWADCVDGDKTPVFIKARSNKKSDTCVCAIMAKPIFQGCTEDPCLSRRKH